MQLFRWEDIDHRLVTLKLTGLAEEMHIQIEANERRIQFEERGNLNGNTVPSLVLKMKQDCADEWARRVYQIYCDVWQTQGRIKSAAFVRAVSARAVQPTLQTRAAAIAAQFSRFARATNFPSMLRDAHLKSLELEMLKLAGRWQRRLAIEARECEHAERARNLDATSHSSTESQDHACIAHQPGHQHVSAGSAQSQARFLPIRSSVPLSEFEVTVGKLMVEARRMSAPAKYLSQAEILKIAALLDDKSVPVRENLERQASRSMAEYNKQHSAVAIKSWKTASGHPKFRGAVRKRFLRAAEKYRKAPPSILAPSAGTPRTTI